MQIDLNTLQIKLLCIEITLFIIVLLKFKLIVENGSIPVSISGLNPFTKESFKIFQNNNIKSVVSNKYNKYY